ncbi:hypothetical protein CR513_51666, partial [Mucuna pruriens]
MSWGFPPFCELIHHCSSLPYGCLFALDMKKGAPQLPNLCINKECQATSWIWKNSGIIDLAPSAIHGGTRSFSKVSLSIEEVQDQDSGSWKLSEVNAQYSRHTPVEGNLNVWPTTVHHRHPSKTIVVEGGFSRNSEFLTLPSPVRLRRVYLSWNHIGSSSRPPTGVHKVSYGESKYLLRHGMHRCLKGDLCCLHVECLWENNRRYLKVEARAIACENFKDILNRSVMEDVCNYKGMEFLELKQSKKIMADYVAKILDKDNKARVVHYKVEKEAIVIDVCSLPLKSIVMLSIDLVPRIGPLPQHLGVPLLLVEKKDKRWYCKSLWTSSHILRCRVSFILRAITPALVFPNSSEPFIVYSNTSKMSLSDVLMLKDLCIEKSASKKEKGNKKVGKNTAKGGSGEKAKGEMLE